MLSHIHQQLRYKTITISRSRSLSRCLVNSNIHHGNNTIRSKRCSTTSINEEDKESDKPNNANDNDTSIPIPIPIYKIQSKCLNELKDRGYLAQCTDINRLDRRFIDYENYQLNPSAHPIELPIPKPIVSYIGFDATASSLHAGSLIQLMILRCLQKYDHQVICLIGGGTTRIGDPSGKDEARPLYTDEMISHNCASIRNNVFKKLLLNVDTCNTITSTTTNPISASTSTTVLPLPLPLPPLLLNNEDWLNGLEYISFLREFGRYFSINRMLSLESVRSRLQREQSLSFLEFNYSILQAFDYYHLHNTHGAELQIGGSDQWGNIVSGIELIHRVPGTNGKDQGVDEKDPKNSKKGKKDAKKEKEAVFGWTSPLLLTASGAKMGKSVVGGTIWLDG